MEESAESGEENQNVITKIKIKPIIDKKTKKKTKKSAVYQPERHGDDIRSNEEEQVKHDEDEVQKSKEDAGVASDEDSRDGDEEQQEELMEVDTKN